MQKLNILYILESVFPSIGGGGAESQVLTLSKRLIENGHAVTVISPMVSYGSQVKHDVYEGVPVYRIKYPRMRVIGGFFMLVVLARHIFKHRNKLDVIHVHISHKMSAISCIMGKILNIPVITKITGMLEQESGILVERYNIFTGILKMAIRHATYIQATSKTIEASLIEKGFSRNQIILLPNAVDTHKFSPLESKVNNSRDSQLIFLYVGRLNHEKGIDILLNAWVKVFTPQSPVLLNIIGSGPLLESLENFIQSHGYSEKIHLLGHRTNVFEYMKQADVGVLPSRFEGLSNSLLEFMASGLPVISSDTSGGVDLIENKKSGWLFPRGNENALANVLSAIMQTSVSEIDKMGEYSRDKILQYASIENITERLLTLYQSSKG